MGEDISVALKMTDNLADAAARMKGNLTSMRTDVGALRTEMTALNDRKLELKVDLTKAQKELAEAKKAFKETGSAEDELRYRAAEADYSNISNELKLISTQATLTQKDLLNAMDTFRRVDERAEKSSALGQIAQAGLFNQVGQALAGTAATLLTSGLSSDVGSVAGSVFDGAISGASMGLVTGNPMVALAGAAIGAGSSLISGITQVYENQSEAMKSYVSDLYNSVTQATLDGLEAGMATAESREQDLRAFTSILGDDQSAAEVQQDLIEIGRTPPFSYETAADLAKGMLGLGLSREETSARIDSLSNAAAALSLSDSSVSSIVSALESSLLSGKMETRVMKSMSKQGINVYEALAQEFDMSESQVADSLSDLDVERAVSAIYDYMGTRFAGAAEGLSNTYSGAQGILESYQEDLSASMGGGYEAQRTEGLQAQISYLSGEIGQAWQEANELVGQSQAYLDNLKDEYGRQAMTALFTGEMGELLSPESVEQLQGMHDQYLEQMSIARGDDEEAAALAGQQIGALMETAQAFGENEYTVSDAALAVVDIQEQQVDALRENTEAIKAWKPSYDLQQTQSKGMNLMDRVLFGGDAESVNASLSSTQDDIWGRLQGSANGYASGLERVPQTGLYLLHENERVSRAAEAGGGGVSVKVSVDQLVVREEADIQKVAEALLEEARLQAMAGVYET